MLLASEMPQMPTSREPHSLCSSLRGSGAGALRCQLLLEAQLPLLLRRCGCLCGRCRVPRLLQANPQLLQGIGVAGESHVA